MKSVATALSLVALALAAVVFLAGPASAAAPIKIETLSSKPNRVTGGDALMAVTAPSGTSRNKLIVRRNGTVVTSSFKADPGNSQRLIGLVTGLRNGSNVVSAWAGTDAINPARHDMFNSPRIGPLFSGPQQSPYYCTTAALGAGPPTDANCSAPTTVSYSYKSTNGTFKPLADPNSRPSDLAQTTTRTGQTVDYVVRVEQGTINRAVYQWAVLASDGVTGSKCQASTRIKKIRKGTKLRARADKINGFCKAYAPVKVVKVKQLKAPAGVEPAYTALQAAA